ncbi:acetate--CoA ligase family protein [Paucibacter sediminis]|uniref:Acetate--CoA ligase family protein n=1 Tax=Paucibacter sediminis TaxID=3019553 RepID=A0AA95NJE3_9BURK|nr:acetate--CoA ligase family protein [Paucibacter sp. S2-9]WIT11956.1 acetate--CoA ligase family protein [Paucibacter sp. S2-9]
MTNTAPTILARARAEQRHTLTEAEGLQILAEAGVRVPQQVLLDGPAALRAEHLPPGTKVVVKVVAHDILHKTELGGVKIVDNRLEAVAEVLADMHARLAPHYAVSGYSLNECIEYERAFGHEFLVGLRWTEDFGATLSLACGGVAAEYLAGQLRPGRELSVFSPELTAEFDLASNAVAQFATQPWRQQPALLPEASLRALLDKLLTLARQRMPAELIEIEINPLVISRAGELIALDSVVRLPERPYLTEPPQRPLHKLAKLLAPASMAVMGVSEKGGPGRTILQNILAQGFDPAALTVIKPGLATLDGVACVADVSALPAPVDLLVLIVPAAQVPAVLGEVITQGKAQAVIVIPGGLEEKAGTEQLVARMQQALLAARASPDQGPLINGGNCLGVRSLPGRYNTLFIPGEKLPFSAGPESPLALISQSGAFAITRLNQFHHVNPRYCITLGNQSDLTVGDYLSQLQHDPAIEVFAVYVEGFKELDGLKFLRAARAITASGRKVILYRAGRTQEGAQASSSHTASIAGNAAVTRELARGCGVMLAETITDFEALIGLHLALGRRALRGRRLAAVSNAGFECVSMADNLGPFQLAHFSAATEARLKQVFASERLTELVDVGNPLDLTPMCGDAGYEAVIAAVLADPGVDLALVGVVPLTPALKTLGAAALEPDAIAARWIRLLQGQPKPCIAVIDGGSIYDELARLLETGGVPTFRRADRALRALRLSV